MAYYGMNSHMYTWQQWLLSRTQKYSTWRAKIYIYPNKSSFFTLSSDYLILWKSNWVRRKLNFKVFWGFKQTDLSATDVLILYRTAHQDLRSDKFMFKYMQLAFTPRPPNLFHLFPSLPRCLQCWEHSSDPGSLLSLNELSSLSVFPSFL